MNHMRLGDLATGCGQPTRGRSGLGNARKGAERPPVPYRGGVRNLLAALTETVTVSLGAGDGTFAAAHAYRAGPLACVVPILTGKTVVRARRVLTSARCRLGHVRHAYSAPLAGGTGRRAASQPVHGVAGRNEDHRRRQPRAATVTIRTTAVTRSDRWAVSSRARTRARPGMAKCTSWDERQAVGGGARQEVRGGHRLA